MDLIYIGGFIIGPQYLLGPIGFLTPVKPKRMLGIALEFLIAVQKSLLFSKIDFWLIEHDKCKSVQIGLGYREWTTIIIFAFLS